MRKQFFENNKVLTINLFYYLSLIPILAFTSYKNGFLLASGGLINKIYSFQYLFIPIAIITVTYILELIYYKFIKKEKDNRNILNSSLPLFNTLCYLVTGPNTNILIIISILFITYIISKIINTNNVALYKIILFITLTIIGINNNANLLQIKYDMTYNLKDTFIGFGIGEIGSTSLFVLISYIILLFNEYYKKDIPIYIIISYLLTSLIIIWTENLTFNNLLINTLNSSIILISVYIATISTSSPITKKSKLIYGITIGIISSICINIFKFELGIYIYLFIYSIILLILNKKK